MIRQLKASEVEAIYRKELVRDFPSGEVKPLEQILEGMKNGQYFACAYFEKEAQNPETLEGLVGYAYFIRSRKHNTFLLDYLAVVSAKRSGGHGSAFLTQIKEQVSAQGGHLILEVENPAYAPPGPKRDYMVKRIGFYEKNGLQVSGVTCNFYDNEYRILYDGETEPDALIRAETEAVYREFFGDDFVDRHCRFHDV